MKNYNYVKSVLEREEGMHLSTVKQEYLTLVYTTLA